MSERKVIVPTGFLKVTIEVDEVTQARNLFDFAHVRSALDYTQEDVPEGKKKAGSISIAIGKSQIVPLQPGAYSVRAIFGDLISPYQQITIEAGQIEQILFHFGKVPDE